MKPNPGKSVWLKVVEKEKRKSITICTKYFIGQKVNFTVYFFKVSQQSFQPSLSKYCTSFHGGVCMDVVNQKKKQTVDLYLGHVQPFKELRIHFTCCLSKWKVAR